ncbi:MAG: acetoacetate--CoA ligase [Bradyrhizobiaceae bacterium]|nr:acetoacetate--CoA ligase [Bradyrhizobiaceae bacterium]
MIQEGDLLWTPSADWVANTRLTKFLQWLERERGLTFATYDALWAWSVTDLEAFWSALWDYFSIQSSAPYERVLASEAMPGAKWFPGARLNYAQHILRQEEPGTDAVLYLSEDAPLAGLRWEDFSGQVRILATQLRALGVKPGDRVVSYMPNIPQTMIAMLAATAIGAVWASCSPDFGSQGVLDRLVQLRPKVLFCVDGYRYGGKPFDRRDELRRIIAGLDSLEHVIELPHLFPGQTFDVPVQSRTWDSMLDHPPVAAEDFAFEQVPFDHPLWILFSSGTTGLPKPIVHGHGGIILEQLKSLDFHMDLHAGDRAFFYTTTGWMMWNFVSSMLLAGVRPVLYDGNPAYPDIDVLWRMADECGAVFFGASPSYVDIMRKAGIVPREKYKLLNLRAIMPAGSPVSAECTAWFYANVKKDLWIATGSGGTDCCTGLVGGVPILPVYAGEIQARQLGVAVQSFDDNGRSVIDEVGELVITRPMPSMPICFWGDTNNERYRESYFEMFPGVWRHGDLLRINRRGGCFVLGRSDATLNRHGVRIGTAEIYRALDTIDAVADSLIINLDLPGGGFFMPLFVKLKPGRELDADLQARIVDTLRRSYTPRHVPDRIIAVPEIPYTLTGKKMEVPVRRILMGASPDAVLNRNAMRDPQTLDVFVDYARSQRDYRIGA